MDINTQKIWVKTIPNDMPQLATKLEINMNIRYVSQEL